MGREGRAIASRDSVAVSRETLSFGATVLLVDALSVEDSPTVPPSVLSVVLPTVLAAAGSEESTCPEEAA